MISVDGLKRALLSTTNDETRSNRFIEFLESAETKEEVEQLCNGFKACMFDFIVDQELPLPSKLKAVERKMTAPRKAVKELEYLPNHLRSTEEKNRGQHCALDYLALNETESIERDRYNSKIEEVKTSGDVLQLDAKKILSIAEQLIQSPLSSEIAIGIQILTGRRIVEVYLGTFEAQDTHTMIFNGQRKKRESLEGSTSDYLIPVLGDSRAIQSAHERLLTLFDVGAFYRSTNTPEDYFNKSREYKRCLEAIRLHLDDFLPSKVKSATHKNRSFYARCIQEFYKKLSDHSGVIGKAITQALGDTAGMAHIYGHYQIENLPNIPLQTSLKDVGIQSYSSVKNIAKEFKTMTVSVSSIVEKLDKKTAELIHNTVENGQNIEDVLAKALIVYFAPSSSNTAGKKLSAQDKLEKILLFIFENNKDAADDEGKIYPTQSVLSQIHEKWKGSAIPSKTLKTFLDAHKEDVETHKEEVGISEAHNINVLRSKGLVPELIVAIAERLKQDEISN